jgi:hypothetical protein
MAVVVFAMFVSIAWTLSWAFALAGVAETNARVGGDDAAELNGGIVFLMLLSFYWGGMVVSNLAHVTVSGAVAEWYESSLRT